MRLRIALVIPVLVCLSACGSGAGAGSGSSSETTAPTEASSSSSAPSPTAIESSSAAPAPTPDAPDVLFVDVIDDALAPYAALIGQPAAEADLGSVLSLHDGNVPLPAGATIVGAGMSVEEWDDESTYVEQVLGIGEPLTKADLEAFGEGAPNGWTYNSISTTDSSSILVMTRDDDDLRVALKVAPKPDPGEPPTEFRLEQETGDVPQTAWLASLPVLEGGQLVAVAEGVGEAAIEFRPVGGGLVSATWRFPVEQLDALMAYIASGVLEEAGFTLVDPDSISFGAAYIDVTAGEWIGQVIVGETMMDDKSFADLTWYLTRP